MVEFEKNELYNQLLSALTSSQTTRVIHLEPASEMTEEAQKLLDLLKHKIKSNDYNNLSLDINTDLLINFYMPEINRSDEPDISPAENILEVK